MSQPGETGTNVRALRISAALILIYFVFEIAVAITTGSLSLLADAGHELSTAVAIAVSLIAIRLAGIPATPERSFGYLRGQTLAAVLNGVLLLVMAGFIISQAIGRIQDPMEVPSTPMFVMAIGGIGLEIGALAIMYRGQKGDLNIRGSFWHVINAFLGSVTVIIAALFIEFGEIYAADAWAGLFFSLILIYGAYGILRDAFRILIDATPGEVDLAQLAADLEGIEGVTGTHHLHARAISDRIDTFGGHLIVRTDADFSQVLQRAKEIVDQGYGFSLSTIQIETPELVERDEPGLEAGA